MAMWTIAIARRLERPGPSWLAEHPVLARGTGV